MDITPELIAEIDFPDALKGFDKDAVDDFLGQVGTELGRVHYELRKAERRIAELEDEVARAGAQAPAEATESDASKATRTIMAAQETADRIESDATTEAEKTLADAKSEADAAIEVAASEAKRLLAEAHTQAERLEGDARREADEMLVAGKRRAEDEYDARVADYVRLLGEQEQRSDALANDIDALEARVGEYRSVLERLVEEVRRVLDDPDELRFRPTLELSAPAAPVGSPAPVPGSVMPDDPAGVDAQEAVPGDEGWEQGSWSADLEGHPDDAATPDEVADGGLPEDGPVGEDGLGELDPVHEAADADEHPSTSEMA
ncbi:MAG: DivIVA domain-containing protein, partial [Microthrixaceae bacterium]|nr:DivIVA domain-containing protein [Microthrixaceae bacterium]